MNNSGSTGYGPPEDNLPSDYAGQADLFPGEVLRALCSSFFG